jgi:D-alanyl-D-alanine carboxypeptidase
MLRIIVLIVSFALSTFNLVNSLDLPQSEGYSNENELVNGMIDIKQEEISQDIEPVESLEEVITEERDESIIIDTVTQNWWEYPDNIKSVTRDGDDLLVLVNKEFKLPSTYAPSDLVKVGEDVIRRGSNYYLRSIVINDLRNLVSDAKADGIDLSIVSAYRSYSTQESTYNYWVNYNGGCVSCADKISARAGHSQHQLGTTLDFSSNEISDSLGIKFGDTNASEWLKSNAYMYGFVLGFPQGYESVTGYGYEPWHYRYIGRSNALLMRNSGMILEEYLRSVN